MSLKLKRKRIDSSTEKRIITSMIVNSEYLKEIHPLIDLAYFQSSFVQTVADWILDFYEAYGSVPFKHIKDIFEKKKESLDPDNAEMIENLLVEISENYEADQRLNVPYLVDQAEQYFKRRELEITAGNLKVLLDNGDLEEAEKQIERFRKVQKATSKWINPFDDEEINSTFDDDDTVFFQFPGVLGEFLGAMDREWIIGITGPFKRGKCLDEDSLITLHDGRLVSVKEVVKNKITKVVAFNETTQKFVKSKIIDHYNNGIKPVYKITTRTGRSVCITKNHPLLTPNGWKELNKLSEQDIIAVPKKLKFFGTKKIEPYKLKFLAYMITEGCLLGQLSFTKIDFETRKEFISTVRDFGDEVTTKSGVNEIYIKRKVKNNQIPNCKKWLRKLGLDGKKSKDKFIPDFIFTLKETNLALFLSVMFSCDGSIWGNRKQVTIEYSSASKKLIYQIQSLLTRFGIISKTTSCVVKNKTYWAVHISGKEPLLRFVGKIGFNIEKKEKLVELLPIIKSKPDNRSLRDLFYNYDEIKKALMPYSPSGGHLRQFGFAEKVRMAKKKGGGVTRGTVGEMYKATKDKKLKTIYESEVLWDKIKSIEYIGKKQTYDLTVPSHHNFIADNVLVHNTWFAQEFGIIGLLDKRRVAFISLEMPKKQIKKRIYKRLTALGKVEGEITYPCFDCTHNQSGDCELPQRTNQITLIDEEEEEPFYDPESNYRPCTFCRGDKTLGDNYSPTTWFEEIHRKEFNIVNVGRDIRPFQKMYGNNFRVMAYPRFTANVSDIMRDLDILEHTDDFIPEIIIVDYPDILKPEDSATQGIEKEDRSWIALAQLAGMRKCLVIAPTQATKEAMEAEQVKSKHTARWVGKLGHVDSMLALNQTDEEKKAGVMRISTMVHRHEEFHQEDCVTVLQQVEVGQTHLDSEKIRRETDDNSS